MKCKAYVSCHCQESLLAREVLEKTPYSIEFVDISANMENLRDFLFLRDSHPFFNQAKGDHRVGVPTLVFGDNEFFFDVEDGVDIDLLRKYFED